MKKIAFILLITASSFASAQVMSTKTNVSKEQAINEMEEQTWKHKKALEAKEFAIKQEEANRKLAEEKMKLKERQQKKPRLNRNKLKNSRKKLRSCRKSNKNNWKKNRNSKEKQLRWNSRKVTKAIKNERQKKLKVQDQIKLSK